MIKQPQPLSAEEREEKIQYYTDLFYMFNHSYDEYVDDDAYDAIHVTDLYEEDIKSFEDKFAAFVTENLVVDVSMTIPDAIG